MQTTQDMHKALLGILLDYSVYTTEPSNLTFYVKSFKVNYCYICNTELMCYYGAYHLDNKPIIIIYYYYYVQPCIDDAVILW